MEKYMKRAVELAELAGTMGEIPVGAVVVKRETGEIVAEDITGVNLIKTLLHMQSSLR